MLQQITYAGTQCRSFAEASAVLAQLADLTVSPKQVERVTERIGAERVAEREAHTTAFQALPLVEKFAVPADVSAPALAVVMADGGRLQILDRRAATRAAPPAVPSADAATPTTATTPTTAAADWDEAAPAKGHWREDKVGLLLTMHSATHDADPCPEVPAAFVDVVRIPQLVRQLKSLARASAEAVADDDAPDAAAAPTLDAHYQPPQVVQRQLVASRGPWSAFAPQLAAAARAAGFQGADRRAFVGDGAANNWTLQRRLFGSFVPILDFIHALSYVFAAAMAGRSFAAGWACYQQWLGWVWRGDVTLVLAALQARQAELGLPAADEAETSPRQVVRRTWTYLHNHQDKMHYAVYRQQGLPITSSLMESAVKQMNQRVKGTEKFWSEAGSEAVLQLRADQRSDGQPLDAFWQRRQANATGQRPYRRAG